MLRHRLTDEQWNLIVGVFPEPKRTGRPPRDRRQVMDGILWILRTGSPWRDLPDAFGPWATVWDLFDTWNHDGTLQAILDEATSNLDTESEQLIQASLVNLLADRTTFVIAHRLSTITRADMIVVMDRGRIVETGTHAELAAAGGVYTQMFARQIQFESDFVDAASQGLELENVRLS